MPPHGAAQLPPSPHPRPDGAGFVCLRCADFGEHTDCLTLIRGTDAGMFLESLRTHLRDVHGVTTPGFLRRREAVLSALLSSLDELHPPSTQE